VYSRAEGVSGGNGMVGFALNAVKLCGAGNGAGFLTFFCSARTFPGLIYFEAWANQFVPGNMHAN
jgi:hypothetical protein